MRQTERKLEQVMRLLVERYGASESLGEVLARCSFIAMSREGDVTVSSLAHRSGLPRQSVSRWTRDWIIEGKLIAVADTQDERRRLLFCTEEQEIQRLISGVHKIIS